MIGGGTILKKIMKQRGFVHRRSDDPFTLHGEYARNTQYVYSRESRTHGGTVIDLIYFAADVLSEKLVISLYRENPDIENGVLINHSRSLDLQEFSVERIDRELDKLITPIRDRIK